MIRDDRNVTVIKDPNGNSIVMINDIVFKGKRWILWDDVEEYLKQHIGEFYSIEESLDIIYIGSDLPDEYTHSKYTKSLKGTKAKAKANAALGLPELIEIATNKSKVQNEKQKHRNRAKYGWYRYESRFALPVFSDRGEVERYNVFNVAIICRHASDGKIYLYDILNIKKETSKPLDE